MWGSGRLPGRETPLILSGRWKGRGGNDSRRMHVRMGCTRTRCVCGDVGSVFHSPWKKGDGQDQGDSEGQGIGEVWVGRDDIRDLRGA